MPPAATATEPAVNMTSELSISLQQSLVIEDEKSREPQTKQDDGDDPISESKLVGSGSSVAHTEDELILVDTERTPSFLPDTVPSDDNSAVGLFFEEENNQTDNDDDDAENDINPDDLGADLKESSDVKAAAAQQQEVEEDCDDTAPLSTSTTASFPAKSILKADVDEITDYAINLKKSKWKKLGAPDMDYVKMKRVESLTSIASSSHRNSTADLLTLNCDDQSSQQPQSQPQELQDDEQDDGIPDSPKSQKSTPVLKKQDSRVQFQHIVVREYQQTIGDNPSVGYGTPITLDWEYQENEPLDVDMYEGTRGGRRNIRQMHLNSYQRKNIFIHKYGFTEKEVRKAKKATNKVRSQREWSKMVHTSLQPLLILEEMRESAVRKFKRYRGRNSVIECESTIWMEEHRIKQQAAVLERSMSDTCELAEQDNDDEDANAKPTPELKRVLSNPL